MYAERCGSVLMAAADKHQKGRGGLWEARRTDGHEVRF